MNAGIRTPAGVIALALEDNGVSPSKAKALAEKAAERLGTALRTASGTGRTAILVATPTGIDWETFYG